MTIITTSQGPLHHCNPIKPGEVDLQKKQAPSGKHEENRSPIILCGKPSAVAESVWLQPAQLRNTMEQNDVSRNLPLTGSTSTGGRRSGWQRLMIILAGKRIGGRTVNIGSRILPISEQAAIFRINAKVVTRRRKGLHER